MPRLPGYALELHRVVYSERVAVAEITETIEMDSKAHITPEALVFDLTESAAYDPRTDLWLRDGDVIEVPEKS